MKIVDVLFLVFLFIEFVAILFYIPRMSMWITGLKPQKNLVRDKKAKFAIIIPARNESKIISHLFDSIISQTYPKDLFDIYCIVDNELDPTIGILKNKIPNANILVLENQKRKAEPLDFCFKTILSKNPNLYDDYIIVDADNILTPNFLEEMNNALESNADVIIPRKIIKNWESKDKKHRTLFANCSAATYVGLDAMGNKTKCKKNYTLALCGQGMLISNKIIKELNGYPFRSITEDFEIAVECIRKGYNQFYYEYAKIYSEEPTTRKEYNKRRIRWIKGFAEFNSLYNDEIHKIIKQDKQKKKQTKYFRSALVPVYVMFAVDVFGLLGFLIYGIILSLNGAKFFNPYLICGLLCLLNTYLQLFVYGIMTMCEDREVNKMTFMEKLEFILLSPFVTMEYIWIFVVAFTTNKDFTVWEPVERLEF